jgi:hypothetical protein
MKAGREEFETARARKPHWVGNDPVLEIGRARFLVVTARVKRCRSLWGPSTDSRWSNVQRRWLAAPGKRFENSGEAEKKEEDTFKMKN